MERRARTRKYRQTTDVLLPTPYQFHFREPTAQYAHENARSFTSVLIPQISTRAYVVRNTPNLSSSSRAPADDGSGGIDSVRAERQATSTSRHPGATPPFSNLYMMTNPFLRPTSLNFKGELTQSRPNPEIGPTPAHNPCSLTPAPRYA